MISGKLQSKLNPRKKSQKKSKSMAEIVVLKGSLNFHIKISIKWGTLAQWHSIIFLSHPIDPFKQLWYLAGRIVRTEQTNMK